MRLAAPGYRLRSHYYAYGSNVRNRFRSLHTNPADTLHPESRASRRQDGMTSGITLLFRLLGRSCRAGSYPRAVPRQRRRSVRGISVLRIHVYRKR